MSNRTERRAAEHASRKLAYKQLRQQQSESNSQPAISEIQLAANQANAQRSHGPVTPEGKAKSSKTP